MGGGIKKMLEKSDMEKCEESILQQMDIAKSLVDRQRFFQTPKNDKEKRIVFLAMLRFVQNEVHHIQTNNK